jgi:tetratricopeptide (TPR) repeat protein
VKAARARRRLLFSFPATADGKSQAGAARIISYCFAFLAVAGACFAFLLASASIYSKRNTADGASRAASLVPFNAEYLIRHAGWQPQRRSELLTRALALNPYAVPASLQLGFQSEFSQHDLRSAEAFYLQAAAEDQMFLPQWTLANFYFRQGRAADFLRYAKASLNLTPYSPDPIFADLLVLAPTPEQRDAAVPDRPGILEQYLMFLYRAQHWSSLPHVLDRLVRLAPGDPKAFGLNDVVGPMLDGLLRTSQFDIALRMWNILCEGHWLPYPPKRSGDELTNERFTHSIWGHGIDWIPVPSEGTRERYAAETRSVQFDFSGDEPENFVLFQQWIRLSENVPYALHWSASSSGLNKPSGFFWEVRSENSEIHSEELLDSGHPQWLFSASHCTHGCLLSIRYKRPVGETRPTGTLQLRAVSLQKP